MCVFSRVVKELSKFMRVTRISTTTAGSGEKCVTCENKKKGFIHETPEKNAEICETLQKKLPKVTRVGSKVRAKRTSVFIFCNCYGDFCWFRASGWQGVQQGGS